MRAKSFKDTLKNQGSFTIEAAILFPIIFLCLISVIYLSVIMYQQVYMQIIVNSAARYGFYSTVNVEEEIYSYVEERLREFVAIKVVETRIDVDVKKHILSQSIKVSITHAYNMPLGFKMKIIARAHKTEANPVDFIRTLDSIKELIVDRR